MIFLASFMEKIGAKCLIMVRFHFLFFSFCKIYLSQILQNDELNNWDENETLFRREVIMKFSEPNNTESYENKCSSFVDFSQIRFKYNKNRNHFYINIFFFIFFRLKTNKILNPIKANNQKIHRLEMLNLSDSVSMINIISLLNPKNVVLINGEADDNSLLIVLK